MEGQVFTTCASACPATCSDPNPFCTRWCVAQCECPEGTVIDEEVNQCVPVDECPIDYEQPSKRSFFNYRNFFHQNYFYGIIIFFAVFSTCPPGVREFTCLVDPCLLTECLPHPTAVCIPDFCGGCNARFYLADTDVTSLCRSIPGRTILQVVHDTCTVQDNDRRLC